MKANQKESKEGQNGVENQERSIVRKIMQNKLLIESMRDK